LSVATATADTIFIKDSDTLGAGEAGQKLAEQVGFVSIK
jgi:hypothetical protein